MNGYGRIVTYKTNGSETTLETVREGYFKDGMLDNYGRFYDMRTGCSFLDIGFFTKDTLDGKGERYNLSSNEPYAGIWEHGKVTKETPVYNYESRTMTNTTASTLDAIKKRDLGHQDRRVTQQKVSSFKRSGVQ